MDALDSCMRQQLAGVCAVTADPAILEVDARGPPLGGRPWLGEWCTDHIFLGNARRGFPLGLQLVEVI
jgi:hypothetical protein